MTSESLHLPLDDDAHFQELANLAAKEYLDVLKNLLEVPKYLVSLLVFLATATAAVSRIGPVVPPNSGAGQQSATQETITHSFGDTERILFCVAMVFTLYVLILGFRVVAKILKEMMLASDTHKAQRGERFIKFRRGPYSEFVKWSVVALFAWAFSLISVVW